MPARKQAKNIKTENELEKRGEAAEAGVSNHVDRDSDASMDASDPPSYAHGTVGAGKGRRSTKPANDQAMDGREQRIRDRAHRLWEEEGRPSDRAEAHWRQAEEQIVSEDLQAHDERAHP